MNAPHRGVFPFSCLVVRRANHVASLGCSTWNMPSVEMLLDPSLSHQPRETGAPPRRRFHVEQFEIGMIAIPCLRCFRLIPCRKSFPVEQERADRWTPGPLFHGNENRIHGSIAADLFHVERSSAKSRAHRRST